MDFCFLCISSSFPFLFISFAEIYILSWSFKKKNLLEFNFLSCLHPISFSFWLMAIGLECLFNEFPFPLDFEGISALKMRSFNILFVLLPSILNLIFFPLETSQIFSLFCKKYISYNYIYRKHSYLIIIFMENFSKNQNSH